MLPEVVCVRKATSHLNLHLNGGCSNLILSTPVVAGRSPVRRRWSPVSPPASKELDTSRRTVQRSVEDRADLYGL